MTIDMCTFNTNLNVLYKVHNKTLKHNRFQKNKLKLVSNVWSYLTFLNLRMKVQSHNLDWKMTIPKS